MTEDETFYSVKKSPHNFFYPLYHYHSLPLPRGGGDGGGVRGGAPRRAPQAVAAAFEKGTTFAVSPSGKMAK